ncbi:MAG: prolipoprotein diacylglyceryl transferase [Longimicrobiales bacterium]
MLTTFLALEIPYPFIDPVLLDLPGPLSVRWYGLMYLVGFAFAYYALSRLTEWGFLELEKEKVGDFIGYLVLGVILGGRLGYILFYALDDYIRDPLLTLQIWRGGLSFHGGLIGVIVTAALFARAHGIRFSRLLDSLAAAVPVGIFFVRMANFVNGELYGRVADADVPWAIRFPTDPVALRLMDIGPGSIQAREDAILAAHESGLWDAIRDQVPLRHPSQVYEALGEGLLVGAVLWTVLIVARRRQKWPPAGAMAGLFFIGYGGVRTFVELFRQPDAQFRGPDDPLGTVLGPLTMGQTLSLFMVLVGIAGLVWAFRRERGQAA